jgi:hypothetical protein
MLSNTPKHEDLVATTLPLSIGKYHSFLPLVCTIESSTARQGMPVHPSIHKVLFPPQFLLVQELSIVDQSFPSHLSSFSCILYPTAFVIT